MKKNCLLDKERCHRPNTCCSNSVVRISYSVKAQTTCQNRIMGKRKCRVPAFNIELLLLFWWICRKSSLVLYTLEPGAKTFNYSGGIFLTGNELLASICQQKSPVLCPIGQRKRRVLQVIDQLLWPRGTILAPKKQSPIISWDEWMVHPIAFWRCPHLNFVCPEGNITVSPNIQI